ncbi:MAG: Mur ligase family protein [Deltaproteobacteria bacterium]|nr:Mur ligase family protein [Candidatus Zymogenaceae bacterium]
MIVPILALTKTIAFLIRAGRIGHGFTWPGEIALRLSGSFIRTMIQKNPGLLTVVIVGTNGKTTSAKITRHILSKNGYRVIGNETGANLMNGVASCLIGNANLYGKIVADVAILEVDENVLPLLLSEFHPNAIMVLNLFRDQLDRYGEVNTIALKWQEALATLTKKTALIMNGNDPQIFYLGKSLPNLSVSFFGLKKKAMKKRAVPHEADSLYCPECAERLTYSAIAYSHIGDFLCAGCGFQPSGIVDYSETVKSPLLGLFNRYNTNAVALMLHIVFGIGLEKIKRDIADFGAAFGRQEIIAYRGRKIVIQLSKNPTGFNQSVEVLEEFDNAQKGVLVLLNDRIPDGRDVSWIWDVDFELLRDLADRIVVSGDRAYDMAIRLRYAGHNRGRSKGKDKLDGVTVIPDLTAAIERAVELTPPGDFLFILPTYSAMLEVRNILTGDEFKQKTT